MAILLSHPYSFRCCLTRAREKPLVSQLCCYKVFNKLNIAICYSAHPCNQSLCFSTIHEHRLAGISNSISDLHYNQ